MMQKFEYARFKSEINLTQYAAHIGYEINPRKSTRSSIVMRKNTDKIIISKRGTLWVYFSVTDDNDNGTIIDFVQKRSHKSIGAIGRELQNWISGDISLPDAKSYVREIAQQDYEPARIAKIFKSCRLAKNNRYLAGRGLTDGFLSDRRFAGRVYADRYHNAVFPHFRHNKICGLELKNINKALFVRGSEKTLWRSNAFATDHTLIIGEAVIDALSYHALTNTQNALYAATGGGLSSEQGDIIADFIREFKTLTNIIIIPDNDQGGEKIERSIKAAISKAEFKGTVKTHKPDQLGQDWNDVYKELNSF